jgi:guanosine-3',5'-bis(diphosphate) 3'-pyrophosphohydrolase
MTRLEIAIEWAVKAHDGQQYNGLPYILHPLRVMERVRVRTQHIAGTPEQMDLLVAAVLHDVVEDTPVTLEQIRETFGDDVRTIVDGVTRRRFPAYPESETYGEFITRSGLDPRSALLKDCDLDENLNNVDQLPPEKRDIERRYRKAKIALHGKF